MKGTCKEVTLPERLVFVNQAVDENDNALIDGLTTVTFEEVHGKTKMTMKTIAMGLSAQSPKMLKRMEVGWSQSFNKLFESLKKIDGLADHAVGVVYEQLLDFFSRLLDVTGIELFGSINSPIFRSALVPWKKVWVKGL